MPKPVIQSIQANKVAVKHTNGIASYVVKGNDRNFHSLLYLSENISGNIICIFQRFYSEHLKQMFFKEI